MLQECIIPSHPLQQKNWVSSTHRRWAEVREAEMTCLRSPAEPFLVWARAFMTGKALMSFHVLTTLLMVCCVGLCCVYLETSFQSSGLTLKAGTSTVIWGFCGMAAFYVIVGFPEGMRSWPHLRILQFALGYIWSSSMMSFWGPLAS